MKHSILSISTAAAMAAAATLAPVDSHAGVVSRLYLGHYHFYTPSQTEAQNINAAWGGTALQSLYYFGTYDAPQSFSTVEILRCYSPYKNVHAFPMRNWAGGSCAAFGFQDEGTIGRIRTRTTEMSPIAGYGVPLYSMTRVIGRSPDGTNISTQMITTSASEAAAYCGNGWTWNGGAAPGTCFWGYGR